MAWEPPETVPTVDEMVEAVNETVAGVDDAKRRLCVALRRHAVAARADRHTRLPNVIVTAPTGVGKTFLTRAALQASGLPYVETNCTTYSGTGWAGNDLSSMFMGFMDAPWRDKSVQAAAHRAKMERWGVVVLDEFDKWRMSPRTADHRDVGKELQAELLRITEGDTVTMRRGDSEAGQPFNTHNILFIALGAFEGIRPIVEKQYGQGIAPEQVWTSLNTDHLIQYGFMEELIGRFGSIVALPPLTITAMREVLIEQVWPRWVARAADEEFELWADPAALTDLAQLALTQRIGARSLEQLIDKKTWRAWSHARPGCRVALYPGGTEATEAVLEQ